MLQALQNIERGQRLAMLAEQRNDLGSNKTSGSAFAEPLFVLRSERLSHKLLHSDAGAAN